MSDDISTEALLSFHPIHQSLIAWGKKYGHILSVRDYKILLSANDALVTAIYQGLAQDPRYIYDRGGPP